jgi:hypothetical protein
MSLAVANALSAVARVLLGLKKIMDHDDIQKNHGIQPENYPEYCKSKSKNTEFVKPSCHA